MRAIPYVEGENKHRRDAEARRDFLICLLCVLGVAAVGSSAANRKKPEPGNERGIPLRQDTTHQADFNTAQRSRLFRLSCTALVTTALIFSIRASVLEDLGSTFGLTAETVGWCAGAAFLAFAISIFIGSPLCDYLGMGFLLGVAALLHFAGILMVILLRTWWAPWVCPQPQSCI